MDDLHFNQLLSLDAMDMHQQPAQHDTTAVLQGFHGCIDPSFADFSLSRSYSTVPLASGSFNNVDNSLPILPSMQSFSEYYSEASESTPSHSAASFEDVRTWQRHYWRPSKPCECCAAHGIDCHLMNEDNFRCSSCRALGSSCSFESREPRTGWPEPLRTRGTEVHEFPCVNPPLASGRSTRVHEVVADQRKAKPARPSSRFPRNTTLILKRWLDCHAENPYPTDEQKVMLKGETGLSMNQISNWLANARRRGKAPSRRGSPKGVISSSTSPLPIFNPSLEEMDPFERWQHSPPEKEAPLALIKQAAASTHYKSQDSLSSQSRTQSHRTLPSGQSSATSALLGHSKSSLEDPLISPLSSASAYSLESKASHHSPRGQDQRRRRKMPPSHARRSLHVSEPEKIYQCTFCTDAFHIKYDWVRHEKTQHLTLEKWICHPLGPIITTAVDGTTKCVYCEHTNPDQSHLETHAHSDCEAKGQPGRTFFRKDHLRQHLRLFHRTQLTASMDQWRAAPTIIRSRCGICPPELHMTFTTWQERADHIAKHYRDGTKVSEWRGDLGFDHEVATLITNATRPSVGSLVISTLPTAVSVNSSLCHELPSNMSHSPGNSISWSTHSMRNNAEGIDTNWQILTRDLGRYVWEQMAKGLQPTDDSLRRQARLLAFGKERGQGQTSADQEEWLHMFKKAHGLETAHGRASKHSRVIPRSGGPSAVVIHGSMGPPPRPLESKQHQMDPTDGIFRFDVEKEDEDFRQVFQQAGFWGELGLEGRS